MKYEKILHFWFEELTEMDWFKTNPELDAVITTRFGAVLTEAKTNQHANWRETARGSLAEVIVLDQFSRNIHRGQGDAFAADEQALELAQVAIDKGFDQELTENERAFLYMPFMHSESIDVHEKALELFSSLEKEGYLKFEKMHKAVIDQFGRYPHRNEALGRESTPEELDWLKAGGGF